jgi:hypothetical protein
MKEKSNEDSEDQRKIKIIEIDQILVSEETSKSLMKHHVLKVFTNNDYIIS